MRVINVIFQDYAAGQVFTRGLSFVSFIGQKPQMLTSLEKLDRKEGGSRLLSPALAVSPLLLCRQAADHLMLLRMMQQPVTGPLTLVMTAPDSVKMPRNSPAALSRREP